jgi:hypothetical protein
MPRLVDSMRPVASCPYPWNVNVVGNHLRRWDMRVGSGDHFIHGPGPIMLSGQRSAGYMYLVTYSSVYCVVCLVRGNFGCTAWAPYIVSCQGPFGLSAGMKGGSGGVHVESSILG